MKKIITLCLSLCLTATLAAPAHALEYSIDAPNDYDFGRNTSIEVIHTADGGAMRNEDVSKNAALIPPIFGSESMNALHTGEYLTPNLAPRTLPTAGAVISGSGDVVTPGSTVSSGNGYQPAVLFTEVTNDLYYKNSSLGRLEIPSLGLSVPIYQGTDSKTLAKGVGHFEDTSIWEGNVCLAAHNRGANSYFGQIHTLDIGDKITLTTKLGMRTLPMELPEEVKQKMRKDDPTVFAIWEKIERSRQGDLKSETSDEEKEMLTSYLAKLGRLTGAKDLIDGRKIRVTDNIWFIGTANQDESTFEISDKVYDRAQVVSLNRKGVSEGTYANTEKKYISVTDLIKLFESAINAYKEKAEVEARLEELDAVLMDKFDISFGNRIVTQTVDFAAVFTAAGGSLEDALDYQISTKILRKVISSDDGEAFLELLDATKDYKETQRLINKRIKDLR